MEVVVDTSVLREKYPLPRPTGRFLQAFADHHGAEVILPDVVVREMKRWVEDEVRRAFKQLRVSAATLRKSVPPAL